MNNTYFISSHFEQMQDEFHVLCELVNLLEVGICVTDINGHVQYMNRAALEFIPAIETVDPREVSLWSLLEGNFREPLEPHLNDQQAAQKPDYLISRDNTDHSGYSMTLKRFALQATDFYLMTFQQVPEKLWLSEQFYRQVVEDQVEFIAHAAVDGRITFANQAFADYLSMPVDRVIGHHIEQQIYVEDLRMMEEHFYKLSAENPITTIEHRLVLSDGQIRWLRWTHRAVCNPLGQVIQIQGVGHDITEQKQKQFALENAKSTLEQRLHERNKQLEQLINRVESILNNISDAVLLLDDERRIEQANQAFYRMLNVEYDTYFGKPLENLFRPEERRKIRNLVRHAILQQKPQIIETRLKFASNEFIPVELSASPIILNTRVEGIVCTFHDISQRKKDEQDLLHMLERERQLNELQSRIVTMTSHEFRTPLATIHATSETLRDFSAKMDEEQRIKRFNKIGEQVSHMTKMLDDILTVGTLEQKPDTLQLEEFDFCAFLNDVLDSSRQIYGTHTFTYNCHSSGEIPVRADKKLIRQIITNLLSNAAKYSPEGSLVNIIVKIIDDAVEFTISDMGIGIPSEDQPFVFDMFHRAKNATAIKGTGLGLMITKHAVEAHQGTISLTSQSGEGSQFTVSLPIIVTNEL